MNMEGSQDHAGHDHSAHAGGMDHDKYHGSVGRNPDGSYYYAHGAFLGHIVPGCFFIFWGTWWAIAGFEYYLRSLSSQKPFNNGSWYRLPWGPKKLRDLPLEPLIKVVLPLLGILGELWMGHDSYRNLYASNGMFEVDHLNDWQHSTMYLAFVTSGAVDLLGSCTRLPTGTEHAFLSLAFLTQLQLLAFHLKGPPIEYMVHLILALQVSAIVIVILAGLAAPHNILLASTRPFLTILQGVWWVQTAYIMYVGNPAWDPDYMGSTMIAPVMLAVHMLWIAFAMLSVLLAMRWLHERSAGRPLHLAPSPAKQGGAASGVSAAPVLEDSAEGCDLDLEMSSLMASHHKQHQHYGHSM